MNSQISKLNKIILSLLFTFCFTKITLGQTEIKMKSNGGVYSVPCEVNGLKLEFIFDTGASNVTISTTEAKFMLKNNYLTEKDIQGTSYAKLANGEIAENTRIILKEVKFGGLTLYNVNALVVHNSKAPLLFGQSAISKLGTIQLNPKTNTLTILNGTHKTYDFSPKISNHVNPIQTNPINQPNKIVQSSKTKPSNLISHTQKILTSKNNKPTSSERMVEITTDYGVMVAKLYNETPQHRDNFIKLVKEGFYDSLLFHRVIKSFMIQGGDPLSKYADSETILGSGDVGYKIPAEFVKRYYHKRGALSAARDNNPERASSGCQFYIVQGKTYTLEELERIINSRNLSRKQAMLYELAKNDTIQKRLGELQAAGQKEAFQNYVKELQAIVDKQYNKTEPDKIDYDQVDTYLRVGGAPHLDGDYTVFGELMSGFDVLDKIANTQTLSGDRPLEDIRMKMRMLN